MRLNKVEHGWIPQTTVPPCLHLSLSHIIMSSTPPSCVVLWPTSSPTAVQSTPSPTATWTTPSPVTTGATSSVDPSSTTSHIALSTTSLPSTPLPTPSSPFPRLSGLMAEVAVFALLAVIASILALFNPWIMRYLDRRKPQSANNSPIPLATIPAQAPNTTTPTQPGVTPAAVQSQSKNGAATSIQSLPDLNMESLSEGSRPRKNFVSPLRTQWGYAPNER